MRHHSTGKAVGNDMNSFGNLLQSFRPVIAGVKRRHVGEQRLRGADVARGFFAANVLLARAEREAHRRFAARIFGDADDAAGHLALEFIARREERRVQHLHRAGVAREHGFALRLLSRAGGIEENCNARSHSCGRTCGRSLETWLR